MQALDSVSQCRPIGLMQYVVANLNHVVRAQPDEEPVERTVMERAQGETVSDHGFALWVRVWDNVGGAQELFMPKTAKGALVPVGLEHALPERTLMEAHAHQRRDIAPTSRCCIVGDLARRLQCLRNSSNIINRDSDREIIRVVGD